jgi:hypothetical protein
MLHLLCPLQIIPPPVLMSTVSIRPPCAADQSAAATARWRGSTSLAPTDPDRRPSGSAPALPYMFA